MKIKLVSIALFALVAAACSKDPPAAHPKAHTASDGACAIDGKAPKGECPPGCVYVSGHCKKK